MPEQGPLTVQVTVTAPNEKNTKFQGVLRIQNKDNATDVASIPVTLKTSATSNLTPTNPFLSMMRHWLSFLSDFLRMGLAFRNHGSFPLG